MELDGPITITDKEATFRFKEKVLLLYFAFVVCLQHRLVCPAHPSASISVSCWFVQLMFNIPILKPKVPLTGSLVLKRGKDGLFTSYKESWDQSVSQVLLSAKLF